MSSDHVIVPKAQWTGGGVADTRTAWQYTIVLIHKQLHFTSLLNSCDYSPYIRSIFSQRHADLLKCTEQNLNSPSLTQRTWRPIVFIQPGVHNMSIIIYAYRVAIE